MKKQTLEKETIREIRNILRSRAQSIIEEKILPELEDNLSEWMGELLGKLSTLDYQNDHKVSLASDLIYERLVRETVTQLQTIKKLTK